MFIRYCINSHKHTWCLKFEVTGSDCRTSLTMMFYVTCTGINTDYYPTNCTKSKLNNCIMIRIALADSRDYTALVEKHMVACIIFLLVSEFTLQPPSCSPLPLLLSRESLALPAAERLSIVPAHLNHREAQTLQNAWTRSCRLNSGGVKGLKGRQWRHSSINTEIQRKDKVSFVTSPVSKTPDQ